MSTTSTPARHLLLAGVVATGEAVAKMAAANVWSLSDGDLALALDQVAALQASLSAVALALVADADGRRLGAAQATSTAGWLRGRLRLAPGEAKRTVSLALSLRDECPATGAVLAAGGCTAEQARVIATAMADLPPVEPATRVAAEEFLIGQAAVLDPLLLRRAAEALAETLTTEPDADERALREVARRELTAVPAADGMVRLTGWFDPEGWAQIAAVWTRWPLRPLPRRVGVPASRAIPPHPRPHPRPAAPPL